MPARVLTGVIALRLASAPAEPVAPAEETPTATEETPSAKEAPADATPPTDDAPAPEAEAEKAAPEPAAAEVPAAEPVDEAPEAATTEDVPAAPPPSATPPPTRPVNVTPVGDGRNDDIVNRALLGGGIGSLILSAGLIGVTSWSWTEVNRAERALNQDLASDEAATARDRRDQMRTIGVLTAAGAAVYGITGVVLLSLRHRDSKRKKDTARLVPTSGGLGVRF
ncbi:MAG: hypothetical protein AAGA54_02300 [Myxococcota bacterium]